MYREKQQWTWWLTLWLVSVTAIVGYRLHVEHRTDETHHWLPAPGVVKDSSWGLTVEGTQTAETTFNATVRYSYQVGTERYEHSRSWLRLWSEFEAKDVVHRFPAGRPVEVYYDPEDPSRSVLQRGTYPQGSGFWLEYGLLYLLVTIAVMLPLVAVAALHKQSTPARQK